jgi:hypothetical protein
MNIFGKTLIRFFLTAGMLASCNSFQSTPTVNDAEIMETAISTVSTALAETQRAIPTNTPVSLSTVSLPTTPLPTVSFLTTPSTPSPRPPSPTPLPTIPTFTPLVFTDSSIPLSERIVYYYVVWPEQGPGPIPEGTVHAVHHFAPGYTDETFTSDTAADLRRALEIILHEDSRRIWYSSDLEIDEVTFGNGHADVVLQGEYFAAGDAQPCAASLQILMTVFANPSVQTAVVTLNGGMIGNLCIFRGGDPPIIQTVDDVYTRAVIETYMKENAYVSP